MKENNNRAYNRMNEEQKNCMRRIVQNVSHLMHPFGEKALFPTDIEMVVYNLVRDLENRRQEEEQARRNKKDNNPNNPT